jgi:alpha-ketoglutarate-dependent taurine dioxygenase
MTDQGTPFSLDDDDSYRRWRDAKLAAHPTDLTELIVEIADPRRLTNAEHAAMLERCQRANMAVYVSQVGDDPDKALPMSIGRRFGLTRLDHNRGADDDAITSLTVQSDAFHQGFIPYTDRPIDWHTDGYYNAPDRQIDGLLLHCVHPAAEGGSNALLDPEIAYIALRDADPEHIRALMHEQAMTIPAHVVDGRELRPARGGPVFSIGPGGFLRMRYTHRKRNVVWRDTPETQAALAALKQIMESPSPWHFSARLEPGWGLVSNNVLHTRTGFVDGTPQRLLYRARFYDRIEAT